MQPTTVATKIKSHLCVVLYVPFLTLSFSFSLSLSLSPFTTLIIRLIMNMCGIHISLCSTNFHTMRQKEQSLCMLANEPSHERKKQNHRGLNTFSLSRYYVHTHRHIKGGNSTIERTKSVAKKTYYIWKCTLNVRNCVDASIKLSMRMCQFFSLILFSRLVMFFFWFNFLPLFSSVFRLVLFSAISLFFFDANTAFKVWNTTVIFILQILFAYD